MLNNFSAPQHGTSWALNLPELERLLNIITRSLKERFTKRKKDTEELRMLRASHTELNRLAKLYAEAKYFLGLNESSSHQDLLNRI